MEAILNRLCHVVPIVAAMFAFAVAAQADIYQWEYIDPADRSQGKRQSTVLAPDGAGVDALPGADLSNRNLTKAYLNGAQLYSVWQTSSCHPHWGCHSYRVPANLNYTNLADADFENADLSGARFWGANLTGADLRGAQVQGAAFSRDLSNVNATGISLAQLYATASYQAGDLSGIDLHFNDLAGGNFSGQNLSNANFYGATVTDADFTGADIRGASFGKGSEGSGITVAQIYSTASYQARDLSGIDLIGNDLSGINFVGQRLTSTLFANATLVGADFTAADIRRSIVSLEDLSTTTTTNMIWPNGHINGLNLSAHGLLVVRDDHYSPQNITIDQYLAMGSDGTLRMVFGKNDPWFSTISFAPGIPVTLGGTLDLAFADDVNLASQVGRTFDIFDWNGVAPTGAFTVSSRYAWDLSNLYTTGEVTLAAIPEPDTLILMSLVVAALIPHPKKRTQTIAAAILPLVGVVAPARADIYQWEYINPADPSQGKRQSTTLAPDGAGVDAVQYADLQYRDLSKAFLVRADLRNARGYGMILTDADLSYANLTNANFGGVTLTNADFTGAEIRGASFSSQPRVCGSNGCRPETGMTLAQLYSTASYQARDLSGLHLSYSSPSSRNLALAGGNFTGQNLSNGSFFAVDLWNANFGQANLTDAYFDHVALGGADFSQANLTNANFYISTLTNANFTGANVRGARLDRITLAQLYTTSSYQNKDLSGIQLAGGDLVGGNFARQNLSHANLSGDLTGADFTDAEVRGASFSKLTLAQLYSTASYKAHDLNSVGLGDSNLTGGHFAGQNFRNARFFGATLTGADFTGADVRGASFINTALSLAQLYSTTSYQTHDLTGIDFWGDLSNGNFAGQNLTDTHFGSTTLTNSNFTDADVRRANFSGTGFSAAQLYATASYKSGDLSGIQLANKNLSGWNFAAKNLTDAVFGYATLIDADFEGANLTNAFFYADVLTNARFTGAEVRGASFAFSQLTAAQLYSTASHQNRELSGVQLKGNNLSDWNFVGQNLTDADFSYATLTNVDFTGAKIRGANFHTEPYLGEIGITLAQLYPTASYHAQDLSGIDLTYNNLAGGNFDRQNLSAANFGGANLTGANFREANLSNADFAVWQCSYSPDSGNCSWGYATLADADLTAADARGALGLDYLYDSGATTTNLILPNGHIAGLSLDTSGLLVVRDHKGNPKDQYGNPAPAIPISITVDHHLEMDPGGTLRMVFEADAWDSTISFAPGIPVSLGGTLELTFAADVNPASQVGRTFDLFDWTDVDPTGAFAVFSHYRWDTSNLYTTGEITLIAVPEPAMAPLLLVSVVAVVIRRRSRITR